ncbi:MAG: LysM peptidoglycan-binding domain-containing protein [Candidatus Promineofilum sp.]|nr:LysM peptidoglycan-binding domain-containing protein [Promineifilum sp.]
MSRITWLQWLFIAGLAASGLAAAPPRQEATPAPATEAPAEAATDAAATFPFVPPAWISPTPDAMGAIVVIVQSGESMWVIAARAGLSLPELLAYNNLTEQSIINPGDALIVGYVTPEVIATPEETTPTPAPPPPTLRPTEPRPEAAVCLTAFDDLNRDGIHDAGEPLRPGVAFTIYNSEAVVANYITDGRSEPKCLSGLAPGEYRVTRSLAPGETLTTAGNWTLNLAAGSELRQAFGSVMGPTTAAAAGNEQSPPEQTATPTPPEVPVSPPAAAVDSPGLRIAFVGTLFLGGLLLLGAVLILLLRPARNPLASPAIDKSDDGRRFRNIDDLD